jgi:uncharacterized protein YhhL (DUF1145 family)
VTGAGHGWRRIRWVLGPLAATALTAVLATRGYVAIDATRVRLVTAARDAESGAVRVSTAGRPEVNRLQAPFALIARIDNRSGNASSFTFDVDGARVCEASVAARTSRRIDCAVTRSWDRSTSDHAVVVRSDQANWALSYLELAVHHGGSSGFNRVVVVPVGASGFGRPGALALSVFWLLITAGFLLPFPAHLRRAVRIGYGVVVAVIGVALIVIAVAPRVSNYQVMLSAATLARWSCLLMAPQIVLTARAVAKGAVARGLVTTRVKIALAGLLVFAAFALAMHSRLQSQYRGNYSGFLHISTKVFNDHPMLSTRDDVRASLVLQPYGYDAQFMYFAAFDPFLRAYADHPVTYGAFMDAPGYRFGRVGFSLLTRVLSAGQWSRYPATMVWLVIAALGISAVMLASMAVRAGASPAWGVLILLVPGFWQSLSTALPEPIAAALLIGGCWCALRGRWLAGAALWGAALLVRETSLIVVVLLLAERFLSGQRKTALAAAAVAFLPVIGWRLYVGWVLWPYWGWQGFLHNPHDFGWPFAGFLSLWSKILAGAYEPGMTVPGIALTVLLVGAFAVATVLALRRPSALTISAAVLAVMAVSLNDYVWTHVSDGQRLTYEVFVLLALVSPAAAAASRGTRLMLYGFWAAAAWYVFFGSFDAAFVREALTGG